MRVGSLSLLAVCLLASGMVPAHAARQDAFAARLSIDVVAVDRDNRAVEGLGPDDFRVTLDGRQVRVVSLVRVLRGPGAPEAASALGARDGAHAFGAEPTRTVLFAADHASIPRAAHGRIVQAAKLLLDRLGLEDRVAVVALPASVGQTATAPAPVTFVTDRPSAYAALRELAGDASQAGRGVSLANVLAALGPIPGRKTIVFFTGGLPPAVPAEDGAVDPLARAASAAHATVDVIGVLPSTPSDSRPSTRAQGAPSNVEERTLEPSDRSGFSALQSLAEKTGGTFTLLDRDGVRTADHLAPGLASCYVLGLDLHTGDELGDVRPIHVETTRKGVALRGPAWVARRTDAPDAVVWAPAGDVHSTGGAGAAAPGDRSRRNPDLDVALARVSDYVDAYQRAFSIVVAEERYEQTAERKSMVLRSDLLLTRPTEGEPWTSFRDVYEVDGVPLRDRDERLRRLFVEHPAGDTVAQLQAIKEESARYNIGPVQRTLNVPLYPLCVLGFQNRWRFQFSLGRKADAGSQPVWRVVFEETLSPTIVRNPVTGGDVPMKGWFDADPGSGAIVETHLQADTPELKATFAVKYRRDETLGLWLPSEMKEDYVFTSAGPAGRQMPSRSGTMQARATYSNFRRFQVTTGFRIEK